MKRHIILAIILFLPFTFCGCNKSLSSQKLSPSEAYAVCNEKSCLNDVVTIKGNLTRNSTTHGLYTITDGKNRVFIKFKPEVSFEEIIAAEEQNNILGNGIIEAEIQGNIYYEKGMCTMSKCQDMVNMLVEPKNILFIKKVGCQEDLKDCFNQLNNNLTASRVLQIMNNSKICTGDGKKATGYMNYDSNLSRWDLQIESPGVPGGCSDYCHISENKVIFERNCADDKNNLSLEEPVK